MKDTKTLTIFRRFKDGDIIALFPELEGAPNCCLSYMHIGQHGSADYQLVIGKTKKANADEYNDLREELKSIGYTLDIKQKWMRRRKTCTKK